MGNSTNNFYMVFFLFPFCDCVISKLNHKVSSVLTYFMRPTLIKKFFFLNEQILIIRIEMGKMSLVWSTCGFELSVK